MLETIKQKLDFQSKFNSNIPNYSINSHQQPRVLIISMRGFHSEAFRSAEYEFEDVITDFDYADLLSPVYLSNFKSKVIKKAANCAGSTFGQSKLLHSGCKELIIDKEYDLLFFICQHFWDITCINAIKGWRDKCKKAVLWIDEIWAKEVENPKTALCLKLAKDFDYIFTTQSKSVDAINQLVKRPCYSLPYAVDAVKFCPYPQLPQRHIDVYSIGRRSEITHKSLLELTERENFLYLYDSLKGLEMRNYQEHRILYSNLIKRSRYFIANKAKFDSGNQTGGQEELGSRFFEGAAAGAVMIGTPPVCEAYNTHFDWSDAVIEVPDKTTELVNIIAELDAQPERLQKIRQQNLINSLLRHDWVYRWEEILSKVGLNSTPQMLVRKAYLQNLAEMISIA
ncbi:MAG: glycosyltransferase [Richelia sp. RM2_1_2]|nr:glycosyltransferase [Richelia sp. SM1_7_0]NJN09061.1 glycosyltransferase [Richelia sp. RM1_1_1]NJO26824.1 glycosyltransferase [Richelia sp. SL_2_1]NJO58594.1 glycosyltransferase [Richelia sp. RM2_1_2]